MSLAQSYAFIMKKGSAKVLMEVGNMFQANKTIVFKKSFRSLENEPFKLLRQGSVEPWLALFSEELGK